MGFVTVNSKSLVVIPKSVRDEVGIYPGDKLKVYFDKDEGTIVMKKMDDVKEMSESISGMWSDNKFKLEEKRESSNERIDNILKKKLQQKGLA